MSSQLASKLSFTFKLRIRVFPKMSKDSFKLLHQCKWCIKMLNAWRDQSLWSRITTSKSQLWNRLIRQIWRVTKISMRQVLRQQLPTKQLLIPDRPRGMSRAGCVTSDQHHTPGLEIKYANFLFLRWGILLYKINTVFGAKANNNHYSKLVN